MKKILLVIASFAFIFASCDKASDPLQPEKPEVENPSENEEPGNENPEEPGEVDPDDPETPTPDNPDVPVSSDDVTCNELGFSITASYDPVYARFMKLKSNYEDDSKYYYFGLYPKSDIKTTTTWLNNYLISLSRYAGYYGSTLKDAYLSKGHDEYLYNDLRADTEYVLFACVVDPEKASVVGEPLFGPTVTTKSAHQGKPEFSFNFDSEAGTIEIVNKSDDYYYWALYTDSEYSAFSNDDEAFAESVEVGLSWGLIPDMLSHGSEVIDLEKEYITGHLTLLVACWDGAVCSPVTRYVFTY